MRYACDCCSFAGRPMVATGGQIALPGGNCEPEDLNDPSRTALREACEELGVAAPSFVLIDSLEPVETATTGYVVYPFLARFVAEPGCWHASSEETSQVRSVDVAALAAPSALGTAEMDFPTWSAPREVPVRRLGDVAVWGLTLRILEPLLPRLLAEEWVV